MKINNELPPVELLVIIARNMVMLQSHLKSIRNMLTFFTVMLILTILVQIIAVVFR